MTQMKDAYWFLSMKTQMQRCEISSRGESLCFRMVDFLKLQTMGKDWCSPDFKVHCVDMYLHVIGHTWKHALQLELWKISRSLAQ